MRSARSRSVARPAWQRWLVVAAAMTGLTLAAMAVLAVAAGIALSHMFHRVERTHLQPITIDPASCSYVEDMHRAAKQFQHAYPVFGIAYDSDHRVLTWTEIQLRLAAAADVLDYSITASVDQFPTQVQWYLTAARDDLRIGRTQLPALRDGYDFVMRTSDLYADGKQAFGYASDLIGNQCAVPLGA